MTLAELQNALRAADPRAVLVHPRILERILIDAFDLRGSARSVPHRMCFVVDRQTLFRYADQSDLDLEPDHLLPDTVILLIRPDAEELGDLEKSLVLQKNWRRLFHACIHIAMEPPQVGPTMAPTAAAEEAAAERLRKRIEEIGLAEFEEIRTVLTQDSFLLPSASDQAVYTEFAAIYLETRFFSPQVLPAVFPGIRDHARIDAMLAEDVDAVALYQQTRLAGAPEPTVPADRGNEETESHEHYWLLVRAAERSELSKNLVRAAILRMRAWRIAPAALSSGTREQALGDMHRLVDRLTAALKLTPEQAAQWDDVLPLLLDKADQGTRPAEARFLEDLQRVCLEHESDVYTLDLVEWALSGGKRPVKRPLPGLRLVRTTRHLRAAAQRLGAVRLSDADRARLTQLVNDAQQDGEQAVKTRFGRALTTALEDAGLRPSSTPERTAFAKMIEEWLDRIISHGFLTFGDLRDGISRNQLKMPDLRDPEDFIRGDPLLRLDRRLASLLDGVYRPGEIYMRWLERFTAVNFGTRVGRAITKWITIPVGGAILLLQVLGVLFHLLFNTKENPGSRAVHDVFVGPWLADDKTATAMHPIWHFMLLGGVAAFIFALMHSERFRADTRRAIHSASRGLRIAFIEIPVEIYRQAPIQRMLRSWAAKLIWWYALKPLLLCMLIWLVIPSSRRTSEAAWIVFLAVTLIVNSRLGVAGLEATSQSLASLGRMIRAGLLPELYRLILQFFRQIVDGIELVLATIDDWLRFRSDETEGSQIIRAILGVIWFPISYVARFYMVVLIEPGFNPIKAPVSYMAAKVMLPLSVPLTGWLVTGLRPVMWEWLAYTLVVPTVWLMPDLFGFLFWETKENWRLYRANRGRELRAIAIGPHGETIRGLLMPGFHSGTVPRLYKKLRRAERQAQQRRNWSTARHYRHELEQLGCAVERFVTRELLGLLRESVSWHDKSLSVAKVDLAVNRIDISLALASQPNAQPMTIEIELRHGWLLAGLGEPGWLYAIDASARNAFTTALAALYKLSGVDLVRDQIARNLPSPNATWAITEEGFILRAAPDAEPRFFALSRAAMLEEAQPENAEQLIFSRAPLRWADFLASWEQERLTGVHPGIEPWNHVLIESTAQPADSDASPTPSLPRAAAG
jgi:hypothetical protein